MSGGEFQRVLIARAIAKKPDLLVLDEPVQGVDYNGEIALYNLIKKISGKGPNEGNVSGNNKEDRLKKWYEHFKNLPSLPSNAHADNSNDDNEIGPIAMGLEDNDIDDGEFTLEEYRKVLKNLFVFNPIRTGVWVSHEPGGGGLILAPPSISALRHLRNWC